MLVMVKYQNGMVLLGIQILQAYHGLQLKIIYDTYKFENIQYIIENNIHFVPINKIEMIENVQVYDFHVPSNNSFIGNGIINHNTINLPKTLL